MRCVSLVGGLIALALAGCASSSPSPLPIREVVAFGDSLSDCGAFSFIPTTPPARAWDQQLAQDMGYSLRPNWTGNLPNLTHSVATESFPKQLCYAQSGAHIAGGSFSSLPISGTVQLDKYLAEHKRFTSDQLVTVYLGTNDVLGAYWGQVGAYGVIAKAPSEETVKEAARQLAVLVAQILDHGAEHVAVLNLYDLGKSSYNTPILSKLTQQFNATLASLLPRDSRIVPIDTYAFFAGLAANPKAYGFKHPMEENACRDSNPFAVTCFTDPALWKSPDAGETYILIGMVHFTGRTEKLLANYVWQQVEGKAAPKSF